METVSARMEPFPGLERTLASTLEGLGFQVFRVDGVFTVEAPADLWRLFFDKIDLRSREVGVPDELADLVSRIVFFRSLTNPNSD